MTQNELHFGVIVGIDHYPALGDLSTARSDAIRFRDWLADPHYGNLPTQNIITVDASQSETSLMDVLPTQRQVNSAMLAVQHEMELAVDGDAGRWGQTRLYVFVAGHGIVPNGGGGALVMADATPELLGYHVDLCKYLDWYRINAVFREVVVFADCCRVVLDNITAGAPPFPTQKSERRISTILGYASMPGGVALGDVSASRGVFTSALVQALSGDAADDNGEITYESLEDCVQDYLVAETAVVGSQLQRADFDATGRTCVVARVVPVRQPRDIRLLFKTPFSGLARLIHGNGDEEPFIVDDTMVPMTLPPGLYKVEAIGRSVPFRHDGGFRVFARQGSGDVEL
ncbi:caspase family protein [Amycolatopsis sp. cmx-4-68]|uniref:caspase family protein n=1 Tax=Amycolatopsis sp. cmx-4-68 TaxID=2790938 RepID=UPI00397A1391